MTTLAIFIHICWEENQENGNICAALLMELIFVRGVTIEKKHERRSTIWWFITRSSRLKGVIYDNACNFHSYLLGREPREWQYLRCLVDGAHFCERRSNRKKTR